MSKEQAQQTPVSHRAAPRHAGYATTDLLIDVEMVFHVPAFFIHWLRSIRKNFRTTFLSDAENR